MFLVPLILATGVEEDIQSVIDVRKVPHVDVQELGVLVVVLEMEDDPLLPNSPVRHRLATSIPPRPDYHAGCGKCQY